MIASTPQFGMSEVIQADKYFKMLEFHFLFSSWLRHMMYNLHEVPRRVKFIESESTLVDARGWWRRGGEGKRGVSV